MKKQRKLQPKIEKLFKAIECTYPISIFDWAITLKESDILNSNLIIEFKHKHNVEVRIGMGCLIIVDNLTNYEYIGTYEKNRLSIDCRLK